MIAASKYHSYGNDFLVVESAGLDEARYSDLARAICGYHTGVGGDGCVFIGNSDGEYHFRIFNRDGSESGMSGNGGRCACAYLHHKGLAEDPEIRLHTRSGVKVYSLLEQRQWMWTYSCQMGLPLFEPESIPFSAPAPTEKVEAYPLDAGGETVMVTAVSVGNPQCVVFVDSLPNGEEFERLGRALEGHSYFPRGTNVSFALVEGSHTLRIEIWERGVGRTSSSGTGACGAAVAAISTARLSSPVEVLTDIGAQLVEWEKGSQMVITGQSEFVADIGYGWQDGPIDTD